MTHDLSQTISWLHFGDLHITTEDQPNYREFLALIQDANENIADGIDFAVLPGDNADDARPEQYDSIRRAGAKLRIPLEIRTGDHDRKSGTLDAYEALLEPAFWRNRIVGPAISRARRRDPMLEDGSTPPERTWIQPPWS